MLGRAVRSSRPWLSLNSKNLFFCESNTKKTHFSYTCYRTNKIEVTAPSMLSKVKQVSSMCPRVTAPSLRNIINW